MHSEKERKELVKELESTMRKNMKNDRLPCKARRSLSPCKAYFHKEFSKDKREFRKSNPANNICGLCYCHVIQNTLTNHLRLGECPTLKKNLQANDKRPEKCHVEGCETVFEENPDFYLNVLDHYEIQHKQVVPLSCPVSECGEVHTIQELPCHLMNH